MFHLMDEEIIELQKDTEKNLKMDIEHHLVNIADVNFLIFLQFKVFLIRDI